MAMPSEYEALRYCPGCGAEALCLLSVGARLVTVRCEHGHCATLDRFR